MARKTREEALETRQRILDTAARMFGQQGIAVTSLQDIAAAAEVSRGAIYWHFKNKSDLLSTLLDEVAAQFDQALLACQPQAPDPIEQAKRHAVSSIALLNGDNSLRHFFQALIYNCDIQDSQIRHREARVRIIQTYTECFQHALALKQIRTDLAPSTAAHGLHALVSGLFRDVVLFGAATMDAQTSEQTIGVYLDGLKATR